MIRIENLHVHYDTDQGSVHAVRGIDIDVAEGQFFTLLGPSGCGKTTTLRCLAGLETPDAGRITIDGEVVFSADPHTTVPPYRRDIGMVFQSYAIWPHMTVFQNAAFPLQEMRPRLGRGEIREKVAKALELVQLSGLENRPAPFLSGGQQQRLALARALVREPKVLLLDEPLSNLDAKLREETRIELRALVKRLGITTVYVTHDQLEALTMSDLVAVMEDGLIAQTAPPIEIYQRPGSRFVAGFIGHSNFLGGTVRTPRQLDGLGVVDTAAGRLSCVLPDGAAAGSEVTVVIRPEDVHFADTADGPTNVFQGEVTAVVYMGDMLECQVAVGDAHMRLRLHPSAAVVAGQSVSLAISGADCRALAG